MAIYSESMSNNVYLVLTIGYFRATSRMEQ